MAKIISTLTAEHIGRALSDKFELILPDKNNDGKTHFPDGERYMRISKLEELANEDIVVLHSGAPNPNEGLVELEMILDLFKFSEKKANSVAVFFLYYPYSRQDKIFKQGESKAAKYLLDKITQWYGVKRVFAVDPHFDCSSKDYSNVIPVRAKEVLIDAAKKDFGKDIVFVGPDIGSQKRLGIDGLTKKRKDSYTVEVSGAEELKNAVKGKTVGVIDDILGTGGTLTNAGKTLISYGAKDVIALITHGLLPAGIERIVNEGVYKKLYITNTIVHPQVKGYQTVDIAPVVKNALLKYYSF